MLPLVAFEVFDQFHYGEYPYYEEYRNGAI